MGGLNRSPFPPYRTLPRHPGQITGLRQVLEDNPGAVTPALAESRRASAKAKGKQKQSAKLPEQTDFDKQEAQARQAKTRRRRGTRASTIFSEPLGG